MYPRYLNKLSTGKLQIPLLISETQASRVTPHRHDFLELQIVLDGRGIEYINGVPHKLEPGSATFLLPYQIHELQAEPDAPFHICNCNFDMSLLMEGKEQGVGLSRLLTDSETLPAHICLEGTIKQEMELIIRSLIAEYAREDKWKEVLLKAKLFEALVLFDRARSANTERLLAPAGAEVRGGADMLAEAQPHANAQGKVWPVVHFIHQHYREDLSLQQLAEHFHLNPKHLSHLLIKQLGQSYVSFLHELRIRHACSLLRSTELRITDIALETGFGSFQTFSRIFIKLKGMTPSSYRSLSQ